MRRVIALIVLAALTAALWGYLDTLPDPVVRRARVGLTGWPAGAPPLRVALIADVHAQGPDMPPERIARIVAQVNAQKPDLILLAGDFIGDRGLATRHYSDEEIVAPLARLSAPLGVFAVLGNHDHWRDKGSIAQPLERAGIHVLADQALRVGPITLAGADYSSKPRNNAVAVARAVAALPEPLVLFTHTPDVVPHLPPRFALVLAGHTHCGQVVLPIVGALATSSRYGDRYRCGIIREGGRAIIVTSGLGTSVLPIRFGAPPDWWLVTLGPNPRRP